MLTATSKRTLRKSTAKRAIILCLALATSITTLPTQASCDPNNVSSVTPVTATDESATIAGSRQLVNGTNSTVNTSTPGQIKIDVSSASSGPLPLTIATFSSGGTFTPAANTYTRVTSASQINLPGTSSVAVGSTIGLTTGGSMTSVSLVTNGGAGTENIVFNGSTTNGSITLKNGDEIFLTNLGSGTWLVTTFLPQGGSSGSTWTIAQGGTGAANASGARSNLGAAASGANSDITSLSGLTSALSVGQGGTGATSLSGNGALVMNSGGTAVTTVAPGASGNVLTSNGTSWVSQGTASSSLGGFMNNCRITLTSGTPVTTSDVTAATTIYVSPYGGNQLTLYNTGTSAWVTQTFSEASASVPSTTNTNYDVFVQSASSSTISVSTVAWSSSTARATSLTLLNGRYVNSSDNSKLYVGTIRTTGTSGQTEDSQKRRLVWNFYNRKQRKLFAQDPTASWTYGTATIRASDSNTNDGEGRFAFVIGINEDVVDATFEQDMSGGETAARQYLCAIGLDSTTAASVGLLNGPFNSGGPVTGFHQSSVRYSDFVGIGYHYLQMLESASGANVVTIYGTNAITGSAGYNSYMAGHMMD